MPIVADEASKNTASLQFPKGFLWGVSTAAHQVEGGNDNQWTDWENTGHIRSHERCGQACDWWNNAENDFDLAQNLGINALRLSVEWSRVEPQENNFNPEALERYRAMLKSLHQRGIQPSICLHHFSNPRWFEKKGAFLNPEAPTLFERFARRVVSELGDLCQLWLSFNEPNVYSTLGYVTGEFPPGYVGQIVNAMRVMSAQARAHARVYRVIHELQPQAQVGWAQHYVVFQPARPGLDSLVANIQSQIFNEGFFQLMEHGKFNFPFSLVGGDAPEARGACDFVGLNVYNRFHVAFDLKSAFQLFGRVFVPPDVPQGDSGVEKPYGEAFPGAIRNAVERVARFHKPIYITENGIPDAHDRLRPWLIVNALKQVHSLTKEGHDIRGYFHWTLTDNFEWAEGWHLRFGLIELDPATQLRTVRPSGRLFEEIARGNGISAQLIEKYQHVRDKDQMEMRASSPA
jgi:beta-glucosidase